MTELKNVGMYLGPEAVVTEDGDTFCLDCAGKHRHDDEVNMDYVEVDCPWHCDECGALLGGSLTEDGVKYVKDALERNDGHAAVLAQWRDFYSFIPDYDEA
jgi:hypothetical protein